MPFRGASWLGFVIGLIIWTFLFPFTAMMFDSPGSEKSIPTRSLAWALWSYPVFHLIAVLGSRLALWWRAPQWIVRILARLWLINMIWFVGSILWIALACGGQFRCF